MEFNPFFQQRELRELLAKDKVVLEAWFPLGHGDARLLEPPLITALAAKYHRNAGQIILRFEVQEGVVTLPRSTSPARIAGNLDIFGFALNEEEMQQLHGLDTGRGVHDPEAPGLAETLLATCRVHDQAAGTTGHDGSPPGSARCLTALLFDFSLACFYHADHGRGARLLLWPPAVCRHQME